MGEAGCERPEQPVNDGREELNIQSIGNFNPPRRLVKDTESCPLLNPESEAITCKQVMDVDASALPTRRMLPSSFMGNYKRPVVNPMWKGFRKSGGSKSTANVKDGLDRPKNIHEGAKKRVLPSSLTSVNLTVPKGSSDNKAGSQISEKRKLRSSMQPDFVCMVKMKGETDTSKNGGRVLPSSFVGGNSIDNLTRFQPPAFVDVKFHTKLKPSVESIGNFYLLMKIFVFVGLGLQITA